MAGLLTFLLYFVLVAQALAFGIAIIARAWPLRPEPVVMQGIDVGRARDIVGAYIESVHDTHFGFPTGVFRVDGGMSGPERLVAREVNFSGSSGFTLARFGLVIPAMFAAAMAEESAGAAILAFVAGVFVAAFLVVPIVFVSVIEIILRTLMRSRVIAEIRPVAGRADACEVQLELVGLSAFGARRSLMSGLGKPALPVAFGGVQPLHAVETWRAERINQVYIGGAAAAAIVALLILALAPSGGTSGGGQQYVSNVSNDYSGSSTGDTSDTTGDTSAGDSSDTTGDSSDTTGDPADTAGDTTGSTTTGDASDTTGDPGDAGETTGDTSTTNGDATGSDTTDDGSGTGGGSSMTFSLVAGLTGHIAVRAAPSVRAAAVGQLTPSSKVSVVCTETGDSVSRDDAATTTWDRISEPGGFVSDAFVQTGTDAPVASACTGDQSAPASPTSGGGSSPTTGSKSNPTPPPSSGTGTSTTPPNVTDVPTPPAPAALAAAPSQFQGFTIQRPGGDWILDSREVQKQGFVDTRWHLHGDPNVVFVVDYTTGFQGDAVAAADSVRDLFTNAAAYQQLSFAPLTVGSILARRWEYLDGQVHSVDFFTVPCGGTSFAVRGTTPAEGWSDAWNTIFFDAAASLQASC